MLHPSYNELMEYVNENAAPQENGEPLVQSRYTLVMAAAKRARQIVEARSKVQTSFTAADKPLSVAVKELYSGEVRILGENEEPDAVMAAEEQQEAEAVPETESETAAYGGEEPETADSVPAEEEVSADTENFAEFGTEEETEIFDPGNFADDEDAADGSAE